jgi:potassium-transporting ATPase KdpC subunit
MIRPALVWTALSILLLGFVYPGVVTGIAHLAFPSQAGGSLVEKDGHIVGSSLIGQAWKSDKYFHGRPSASNYDATASGGSNLGPTSKALAERIHAQGQMPVDLLTASGSGLDPHISPEAARWQIGRVARARGIDPRRLENLISAHIEGRTFGLFGEPRVNVLLLNLELDRP